MKPGTNIQQQSRFCQKKRHPTNTLLPRKRHNKQKEFEDALNEYYQIRGWNSSGEPTREKMRELGI
jgi:aldehyde:ferredoxin oxidoreductase